MRSVTLAMVAVLVAILGITWWMLDETVESSLDAVDPRLPEIPSDLATNTDPESVDSARAAIETPVLVPLREELDPIPTPPAEFLFPPAAIDGSIVGVVVDVAGGPVRNVVVDAGAPGRTTTDSAGRFELTLPPGALVDLTLTHPSHVRARFEGVRSGQSLRIRLTRWGSMTGSVVDDETGAPIQGAHLRWSTEPPSTLGGELCSASDGTFSIRSIPFVFDRGYSDLGGEWFHLQFEVIADGFVAMTRESRIQGSSRGTLRREFRMQRGQVLRGRVEEADSDRPVDRARVWLLSTYPVDPIQAVTAADGRFTFKLPTDKRASRSRRPFMLMAHKRGYGRSAWNSGEIGDTSSEADSSKEIVLELPRELEVCGRVVDQHEAPLEGVKVELEPSEDERTAPRNGIWFSKWPEDLRREALPVATTGIDGKFRLRSVPATTGKIRLVAEPLPGSSHRYELDLSDPSAFEHVEIVVKRGELFELRVVDESDRPLQGAQVQFHGRQYSTGADGMVREYASPLARTEIQIRRLGYVDEWLRMGENPAQQQRVMLRREQRLSGRVRQTSGRHVNGMIFLAATKRVAESMVSHLRVKPHQPPKESIASGRPDKSGWFQARGLPNGPFSLVFVDNSYRPAQVHVLHDVPVEPEHFDWRLELPGR